MNWLFSRSAGVRTMTPEDHKSGRAPNQGCSPTGLAASASRLAAEGAPAASDQGARRPGTTRTWPQGGHPAIDALRDHSEAIVAAARRRHASRVRVFGSVARGEAGPSSDVDLLVDFDADASRLDQVGLAQDREALLETPADVMSAGGLGPGHRQHRDEAPERASHWSSWSSVRCSTRSGSKKAAVAVLRPDSIGKVSAWVTPSAAARSAREVPTSRRTARILSPG